MHERPDNPQARPNLLLVGLLTAASSSRLKTPETRPSDLTRGLIDSSVTVAGAAPDFHRIPCYTPIGFGWFECTLGSLWGKGGHGHDPVTFLRDGLDRAHSKYSPNPIRHFKQWARPKSVDARVCHQVGQGRDFLQDLTRGLRRSEGTG